MNGTEKISNRFIPIGLAVLMLAVTGCTSIDKTYSGFLGDYSKMVPSEFAEGLFVDHNAKKDLGDYSKFLIAPVVIYLHPDAKGEGIDSDQLKKLSDYFYEQAKEQLSEHYTVVDEPGPGVLLIRAAITDVLPNKVIFNLHWSTTAAGIGLGGASMEAEFVDSQTGERILAVVDARKGNRLEYTKGLTKWGHTQAVLKDWVELLIKRLDELHHIEE